jgi:hypothetical protein
MEERERQQAVNPPKPAGLLYHYTDLRGLLGILESGSIWATHIRFLNDLSESREDRGRPFTEQGTGCQVA